MLPQLRVVRPCKGLLQSVAGIGNVDLQRRDFADIVVLFCKVVPAYRAVRGAPLVQVFARKVGALRGDGGGNSGQETSMGRRSEWGPRVPEDGIVRFRCGAWEAGFKCGAKVPHLVRVYDSPRLVHPREFDKFSSLDQSQYFSVVEETRGCQRWLGPVPIHPSFCPRLQSFQ